MGSTNDAGLVRRSSAGAALALLLCGPAVAQVTSLVSLDADGTPIDKDGLDPELSGDGRYVGFFSYDDLLGDRQEFVHSDAYLVDRVTGAIERLSVSSSEVPGNSFSYPPSLTPDVRYAAFWSFATNLVPGDTNGPYPDGHDVFVRDRVLGTTERVSVASSGAQGNAPSVNPAICADGRFVAFVSSATNLVAGDTNGVDDVFVRDRVAGTTERVSIDSSGAQADGASISTAISADGRFVAFGSVATNLVAGDTNGVHDVFVHDRSSGTIERVSQGSGGAQANGPSYLGALSDDGRTVGLTSEASDLVQGDSNGVRDAFLHDRQTGATERVSVSSSGVQGDAASSVPVMNRDARFVAFQSDATNLVPGDTNRSWDVFVHDRQTGRTERVSVDSSGAQGQHDSGIRGPSLSDDGTLVAFDSRAQLVAADTGSWHDIYVRDRRYTPLASLCEPGQDGVIACPCANPPSGPARGCDNSTGTGGAILSGSGIAYLSLDSLVLRTSAQGPTALSIVLQADAPLGSGAVFGQGIHCVGGTVTRLYTKVASGGSITAPDLGAGDPTISARSAARGDPIQPGEARWYLVYYRDPIVLGGCPAQSAFNATQTAQVVWLP